MRLLHRLVLRVGQELARNPAARAKAARAFSKTKRMVKDDLKPRAQQAWRDAQPDLQNAKRELKRIAGEIRDEYRKGRDGK